MRTELFLGQNVLEEAYALPEILHPDLRLINTAYIEALWSQMAQGATTEAKAQQALMVEEGVVTAPPMLSMTVLAVAIEVCLEFPMCPYTVHHGRIMHGRHGWAPHGVRRLW